MHVSVSNFSFLGLCGIHYESEAKHIADNLIPKDPFK